MAEFAQFSLCNTHESLDCLALGLLLFVVSDGWSQPRLFGPLPHCCLRRIDTSLVPRFLNGYRQLVAAVARYNRAATGGRAFSREIRAADHHSVRRICRFGDARNRKSDGLESFSRVRRGAESGLGICSLVVLLRRRYRLGNSAHAAKQARGPTAYLDRASFFAVPGHRHSRGWCAPWYCVAAGRIFRRD